MAIRANPVINPSLAAIDGTRLVSIPTSTTAKIGMKYIPFIFCKYPKMLSVLASSGAIDMAMIATIQPNTLPLRTTSCSLAPVRSTFLYKPMLNSVQELLSAELKLDRMAPIMAAAKNPVSGLGST